MKRVNDEVCLDTRTAGLVPTTSASGGSGLAVAGCDGTFGSNATINRLTSRLFDLLMIDPEIN